MIILKVKKLDKGNPYIHTLSSKQLPIISSKSWYLFMFFDRPFSIAHLKSAGIQVVF